MSKPRTGSLLGEKSLLAADHTRKKSRLNPAMSLNTTRKSAANRLSGSAHTADLPYHSSSRAWPRLDPKSQLLSPRDCLS